MAIRRVTDYHKRQIPKMKFIKISMVFAWWYLEPYRIGWLVFLDATAYPSLIMNAVPALVAGVSRIVITVPALNGFLNPVILACANLLGI